MNMTIKLIMKHCLYILGLDYNLDNRLQDGKGKSGKSFPVNY